MTIYQFISKFIVIKVKIIHQTPNKKAQMVFHDTSDLFLERFKNNNSIARSRYFNCYLYNDELVIVFMYNDEAIEKAYGNA